MGDSIGLVKRKSGHYSLEQWKETKEQERLVELCDTNYQLAILSIELEMKMTKNKKIGGPSDASGNNPSGSVGESH